jgi:hypothetical protein
MEVWKLLLFFVLMGEKVKNLIETWLQYLEENGMLAQDGLDLLSLRTGRICDHSWLSKIRRGERHLNRAQRAYMLEMTLPGTLRLYRQKTITLRELSKHVAGIDDIFA